MYAYYLEVLLFIVKNKIGLPRSSLCICSLLPFPSCAFSQFYLGYKHTLLIPHTYLPGIDLGRPEAGGVGNSSMLLVYMHGGRDRGNQRE